MFYCRLLEKNKERKAITNVSEIFLFTDLVVQLIFPKKNRIPVFCVHPQIFPAIVHFFLIICPLLIG